MLHTKLDELCELDELEELNELGELDDFPDINCIDTAKETLGDPETEKVGCCWSLQELLTELIRAPVGASKSFCRS